MSPPSETLCDLAESVADPIADAPTTHVRKRADDKISVIQGVTVWTGDYTEWLSVLGAAVALAKLKESMK